MKLAILSKNIKKGVNINSKKTHFVVEMENNNKNEKTRKKIR